MAAARAVVGRGDFGERERSGEMTAGSGREKVRWSV
jgi:hypothetical protein